MEKIINWLHKQETYFRNLWYLVILQIYQVACTSWISSFSSELSYLLLLAFLKVKPPPPTKEICSVRADISPVTVYLSLHLPLIFLRENLYVKYQALPAHWISPHSLCSPLTGSLPGRYFLASLVTNSTQDSSPSLSKSASWNCLIRAFISSVMLACPSSLPKMEDLCFRNSSIVNEPSEEENSQRSDIESLISNLSNLWALWRRYISLLWFYWGNNWK